MRRTARNVLSLIIVLAFALSTLPFGGARPVQASVEGVVISQIYGGGGLTNAIYKQKYIELFNAGDADVPINGWSIQYASPTGTGNLGAPGQIAVLPNYTLRPGEYYLVVVNTGTVGADLPVTADFISSSINMGGTNGKVALAKIATSLGCNGFSTPCSAEQKANIVDFVGYGTANYYEGTSAALALSATTAGFRNNNGCTDTNQNGTDIVANVPAPRNTSSPRNACGIVVDNPPLVAATSPKNNDTAVFVDAPITVTFSEAVDTANGWYQFTCTPDAAPALVVSGGPTTFTFTHTEDFPAGASCTFAIPDPGLVTDRDGTAEQMQLEYRFTFTVETPVDLCAIPATPIYDVQGSGATTPLSGQQVHVQGIVTGDFEDPATGMKGFYLQERNGDNDAATSDGIFVFTNSLEDRVNEGELVHVAGTAGEAFSQTQISSVTDWAVCDVNQTIAPVDVELPVPQNTLFEAYEGMLVRFPQEMVIAEYYQYDQYGEIVLALPLEGEPRPFTGTALDEPGQAALDRTLANSLHRITLDDNISAQNPAVLRHPNGDPFTLQNRFRGGDKVQNAVGVLGYNFNKYRIYPTGPAEYTATNPRPLTPEDVGGTTRVAAMNTLNYFLTADYPSGNANDNKCGPLLNMECRGWDSIETNELTRQRAKLLEALKGLDADVIGLNEIENTPGVEPLADIVAGLPGYDYIDTGVVGTDAIRVGIIYRTAAVSPVGSYQLLTSGVDPRFLDTKNRPSLAQTFEVIATGEKFTVAVNHFKSKGSACTDVGDSDANDGQGNCSQIRKEAAEALVDWLATDPTDSGDPDFIILGDLNSYAMEDTIDAVKAGADNITGTSDDFINLIESYQGRFAYSYTFEMQAGYLDHALANFSMFTQVTGATEWHINSDEPDVVDYDTSYKPGPQEDLYEVNPFRSSDHDPVIVGLKLETTPPNHEPEAVADAFETDEDVTLTVTAENGVLKNDTDTDGDSLTVEIVTEPEHGILDLLPTGAFTYDPEGNFHGTDTFTYRVSDGQFTADAVVTITVNSVDDLPYATLTVSQTQPKEGEMVTFTAGLFDPDTGQPAAFSTGAVIAWKFGSAPAIPGEVVQYAFGDDGPYSVLLTVQDPQHGTSQKSAILRVTNAAPVINPIQPITIGDRGWVDLEGTFTDPGVEDTWTATVDYGDGTGVQPLDLANGKFTLSHQYLGAASYPITIVVMDDDGGKATLTVTVTVEARTIHFLPVIGN